MNSVGTYLPCFLKDRICGCCRWRRYFDKVQNTDKYEYSQTADSNSTTTQKADIVGITYGIVAKLILKIAKTRAEANQRLFALGQQVGQRVADEYAQRQTNSYKPEQVATVLLQGVLKEYLGCSAQIKDKQIKYQKTKFTIKFLLILKQNPLCDFVILPKPTNEPGHQLNYFSLIQGFISGCMASMCYHPTVKIVPEKEKEKEKEEEESNGSTILATRPETIVEVEMWKEKEED